MKVCKHCGEQIPQKRVKLGYNNCVKCSDVEAYGFVNIINHKTGNTVQPMPKEQAQAINKIGDRKRFGTVLKGGSRSSSYNPKNTKFGASLVQIGSPQSFEKIGKEALFLLESHDLNTALLLIQKELKNWNINANQAFQLQQILHALSVEKQSS